MQLKKLLLTLLLLLITNVASADIAAKVTNSYLNTFRGQIELTFTYWNDVNNNGQIDYGETIIDDKATRQYEYDQFATAEEHLALIQQDMQEHCNTLVKRMNQDWVINNMVVLDEGLVANAATALTNDFTGKSISRTIDGVDIVAQLNYVQGFKANNRLGLYFDIDFYINGELQPKQEVRMDRSLWSFRVKNTDTKASKIAEVRDRVLAHMDKLAKNHNRLVAIDAAIDGLVVSSNSATINYQGKVFNVSTDSSLNNVFDAE